MKLKDILKKVGAGLFRDAVPGGGLILDAIGFDGDRETATGETVAKFANPITLEREFDVQLESIKQEGETLRAMLAAEANSKHTTRPYIAKHSFHILAIATLGIIAGWLVAVFKSDDPLESIMSGWSIILALLGPFVYLLRGYFGLLSAEHKNRVDGVHGQTQPVGVAGLINSFIKRGR